MASKTQENYTVTKEWLEKVRQNAYNEKTLWVILAVCDVLGEEPADAGYRLVRDGK